MSESTSNLFGYLGKPVKDEHGHIIGTMASFLVTPGGRINGIFIEHGDGHIKQYSSDQLKSENDEVVLFSPLKMQAYNFCNQIPLLWRKTQAIKDLNEQKKIPEDMYDDLYSSFEGALNQLKTEAEDTIADVNKEVEKCNQRVKELNSALINLEIEREIGQIDDESYQTAIEMVKEGLKRINAEKNDFEALKSKLSNMLLGETQQETIEEKAEEREEPLPLPSSEPLDTSLPEPPESPDPSGESPVVVYVKNVDKPSS
ncbi:MAG: CdvA-like protein [Candidatus Bathyarchaeia archaeon]